MPDIVLVMGSEVFVDWVKHAFITKFNDIPDEVTTDIDFENSTDEYSHFE